MLNYQRVAILHQARPLLRLVASCLLSEYAFTSCDNKIQDVSGNRHGSHGKINYDYISRVTWVTPDSFQLHPLDLIVGINSYSSWPHVHHLWIIIATEQRCRNCRNLHYPSIIPSYNIHILYEYIYIIIIISTVPIDIQTSSLHKPSMPGNSLWYNGGCMALPRCTSWWWNVGWFPSFIYRKH